MFYCDECAKEAGWPIGGGVPRSRGPCECCEVISINTDIPSRALSVSKLPMYRDAIWKRRGWVNAAQGIVTEGGDGVAGSGPKD